MCHSLADLSSSPATHGVHAHSLTAPDPVADVDGMTPLCISCSNGLAQAAVALLDGGASIDIATLHRHEAPGFTPLMYAAMKNNTAIVKMLLKRGADGTKASTQAWMGIAAGSTALDIARIQVDTYNRRTRTGWRSCAVSPPASTGTPTVRIRWRCCA